MVDSASRSLTAARPRGDIQGLRALAVLAVMAFHAGLTIPGGFVGVDIFFVISGFVITLTLLREFQSTGTITLSRFFVRRFKRLVPALAVVIVVTLILSAFVLSPLGPQQTAAWTGLAAALSLGNVAIALSTGDYFDSDAKLNPFLHTWSLGVEEQFYLLFPILLLVGLYWGRRLARERLVAVAVVALLSAVSLALAIGRPGLPGDFATTEFFGFYSPLTRAWEFGVGVLVGIWASQQRKPIARGTYALISLGGVLGTVLSFVFISATTPFPSAWTLLPVLSTAALLVGGTRQISWASQALSFPPLRYIGDVSYSLYLWHWPFVSLAQVVWPEVSGIGLFAVLASVPPALLSYHFVEQKLRRETWSSGRKAALRVGGLVGAPALVAVAMWYVPTAVFAEDLERGDQRAIGYELGCHVQPAIGEPIETCVWPASEDAGSGPPIYLVGDSNAAHYLDGLILATEHNNSSLIAATSRGCPFVAGFGQLDKIVPDKGECEYWQDLLLETLIDSPPGIVLISASDQYWLREDWRREDTTSAVYPGLEGALKSYGDALSRTATSLEAVGHRVVLVQSVPHWFGPFEWWLDSCTLIDVIEGCNLTMPASFAVERASEVRQVLDHVAVTSKAEVVDPLPAVCPRDLCETRGDGYWIYRDQNHISVSFSIELAPAWKQIFDGSSGPMTLPDTR